MSLYRLAVVLVVAVAALPVQAQTFSDASDLVPTGGFTNVGATIVDADGDGRVDLVRPDALLLQRDDGFESVSVGDGLPLGSVFGDVDRDGRPEVLVLEVAAPDISRYSPAREAFVDVPNSGIDPGANFFLTQGSILLDYDRDGALDVLIGNDGGVDRLFRGVGDGTFTDASAVLPQIERGDYGMMAADYDRDGDDDVYIGLCIGITENALYRNDGAAFVEAAASAAVADERPSWGVVWFDFDNDGWLDLFVANMPMDDLPGQNRLYRNNADGTFTDVSDAAGVAGPADENGWNATAADFDNDGWLDLFVANRPEPSRLYRNNADGTFTDITDAAGLPVLSAIPVASGDVNGDGWVDLFMPGGSANQDDALFYNDGGSNGWLTVRLRGTASNPDGIGARVEVTAGDLSMVREITAGDGMMSQSHALTAHFGLGTAATVDVTIRWPSGQVDELTGIAAEQDITVVENVGVNAPPAMFGLTAPADGGVIPDGEPVILAWEAAADVDAVVYTVHLVAPDGTDATFETTEPMLEVPVSALNVAGAYRWAVVARDAYSARTSLGNAVFIANPDVASEPAPTAAALRVEVWPNPSRGTASVRFDLATADAVWLEVIDMLGRRVQRIDLGERGAGTHIEPLEMSGLRAGPYVVRVYGARSGSAHTAITHID